MKTQTEIMRNKHFIYYLVIFTLALFTSCDKKSDEVDPPTPTCADGLQNGSETGVDCGGPDCEPCVIVGAPSVNTDEVIILSVISAAALATITNEGNSAVVERGFVYSTLPNPTMADFVVSGIDYEPNLFYAEFSGLTEGATYYIRAYASNETGISFGNELSFNTVGTPPPPPPPGSLVVVVSAWIDPGNGNLYAAASDGVIKKKTSYAGSWSSVDGSTFTGSNLTTVWIDPGNGQLYGAGSDGKLRKKTSYAGSWSSVDESSFSGNNLQTTWIDPGNGNLYGAGSDGKIRRKTSYAGSWSSVDESTFSGSNLTTAWIDPGNGDLYGAGMDGKLRKKTSYAGSWSSVDESTFNDNNLQSTWIDPGNGNLYGVAADGKLRRKTSYAGSWSQVDDSTF